MATPIYSCAAVCGAPAIAQAGSHVPVNVNTAPTAVANSAFKSGRAFRFAPSAAAGSAFNIDSIMPTSQVIVMRANVFVNTAPASDAVIGPWYGVFLGRIGVPYYKVSDGKIYAAIGLSMSSIDNIGANGVTLPIGQLVTIDVRVNFSANPRTVDVSVNGVACSQASFAAAAANLTYGGWGVPDATANITCSVDMGDFLISQTSADYPLGAGHCLGVVPNADGTHNLGAGGNIQDAGGTDINASTNPAFGDLDELPAALDANMVKFKTDATGATYIELAFPDNSSPLPIICVDFSVFYHGDAANAYVGSWKTSANGFTNSDTIALSPATGVTQRCMHKAYATTPGAGSTWSDALVDAITLRFGFGTDVTPDIDFDACCFEYAVKGDDVAIASTLKKLVFAGNAQLVIPSTVASTIKKVIATINAQQVFPTTTQSTLRKIAASINSQLVFPTTTQSTLRKVTASLNTVMIPNANIGASLRKLTASLNAQEVFAFTIAATLVKVQSNLQAAMVPNAVINSVISKLVASINSQLVFPLAINSTLVKVVASLNAQQNNTVDGNIVSTLVKMQASLNAQEVFPLSIDSDIRKLTASLVAQEVYPFSIDSDLQKVIASLNAQEVFPLTIDSDLRKVTGSFTVSEAFNFALAAVLQHLTSSLVAQEVFNVGIDSDLSKLTAIMTLSEAYASIITVILTNVEGRITLSQQIVDHIITHILYGLDQALIINGADFDISIIGRDLANLFFGTTKDVAIYGTDKELILG